MANSNATRAHKITNVNYNKLSIGDTSIFNTEYIVTHRFNQGDGPNQRNVLYRDHRLLAEVTASGSGKIFIHTCINQAGKSVFVSIDKELTTIKDKETLANALNMVAGYRFEAKENAAQYECGMIKLFLDIDSWR